MDRRRKMTQKEIYEALTELSTYYKMKKLKITKRRRMQG